MEWHFFCTSHGKSECDGLGGTIKRGVHRRAIASDIHVYNAKDFVNSALTFANKTVVAEMTTRDISRLTKGLKKRWANVPNIPGTQSFHYFWPSLKNGFINASMTSSGANFHEFKMAKLEM